MGNSVEDLKQELQNRVAALDKERVEQLASLNTEQEKRRVKEEEAIAARAKYIKEQEDRLAAQKVAETKAEAQRQQKETEERLKAEALENEHQEKIRQDQEQARKLQEELLNAEFAAEQHRKATEAAQVKPVPQHEAEEVDNRHVLTGEAAIGTDGLEVGPELSPHMRSILRRANN
jgi:hypothetical protein